MVVGAPNVGKKVKTFGTHQPSAHLLSTFNVAAVLLTHSRSAYHACMHACNQLCAYMTSGGENQSAKFTPFLGVCFPYCTACSPSILLPPDRCPSQGTRLPRPSLTRHGRRLLPARSPPPGRGGEPTDAYKLGHLPVSRARPGRGAGLVGGADRRRNAPAGGGWGGEVRCHSHPRGAVGSGTGVIVGLPSRPSKF